MECWGVCIDFFVLCVESLSFCWRKIFGFFEVGKGLFGVIGWCRKILFIFVILNVFLFLVVWILVRF